MNPGIEGGGVGIQEYKGGGVSNIIFNIRGVSIEGGYILVIFIKRGVGLNNIFF